MWMKQAQKVVAHLQRQGAGSGAGDQPFVWGKKVEKELAQGKKLKEISIFSDKNRVQERLVRPWHACGMAHGGAWTMHGLA